jgi:hypothetical protein
MVASVGNVFYHVNASNFTITKTLAVEETNKDKDVFVVYPNPSKGILHIKFAKATESHDLSVYDRSGKLVFVKLNNRLDADKIATYPLDILVSGNYVIEIKTKTMNKTVKWVKE